MQGHKFEVYYTYALCLMVSFVLLTVIATIVLLMSMVKYVYSLVIPGCLCLASYEHNSTEAEV